MRYQNIIFDLDGVICHTDAYHYQAWKALADRLGIYFDEEMNNRFRGVSRMDCLEMLLKNYDRELTDNEKKEFAEEKNNTYRKLLENMSPADLSPEVSTTLDALRRKEIRMAIGSSSKNTRYILERIGLGDYFDAVADGNCISRSKPDPEVFLKAAQMLGAQPKDCLVVEDAVAGIQAAAAGDMDSAAIGDAAKAEFATWKLVHFSDLLEIVK